MKSLKKIANNLFRNDRDESLGNGLFASLEELINMRQYVAHLRAFNRRKLTSNQAGDVKSAFKGRGMELEEIRSYNFGDDIRDIDWRVTARKDSPYTKIFAEEKDREIYVLLDLSAHMIFGTKNELKSVAAAKVAALLGWLSLENKDRFGCLIFDGKDTWLFKPQNNRANMMAILKKISLVSQNALSSDSNHENLAKPLKLLEQRIKSQATVFVLSDFNLLENAEQLQLAALSKKTRLYMVNIFDVLEEIPPHGGEYMAEYEGKRLVFNSSSRAFKDDYKKYFAQKRKTTKEFCQKFACRYLEVRTDIELYQQIKL